MVGDDDDGDGLQLNVQVYRRSKDLGLLLGAFPVSILAAALVAAAEFVLEQGLGGGEGRGAGDGGVVTLGAVLPLLLGVGIGCLLYRGNITEHVDDGLGVTTVLGKGEWDVARHIVKA